MPMLNVNMGDLKGDPFGYAVPGSLVPFSNVAGRTSVSPTLLTGRIRTYIIDGQSLGSNHCCCGYTVANPTKVLSVNWAGDRLLYQHAEPCLGGTFYPADYIPANNWSQTYTSIWGKVGDLHISNNNADVVIFCNVSAGGVTASALAPGGVLGQRIPLAFHVLSSLGIRGNQVTAILSMLGESDAAGTDPATFKAQRRETIRASRSFGFTGPWIIPRETYVTGTTSTAIRNAQAELAAEAGNMAGPDFDAYGAAYRGADNIHQNQAGRDAMALAWYNLLAARFG